MFWEGLRSWHQARRETDFQVESYPGVGLQTHERPSCEVERSQAPPRPSGRSREFRLPASSPALDAVRLSGGGHSDARELVSH